MDNSPFNKLKMDAEDRLTKVKELTSKILYLKKNPAIDSKKTIQKLQQQINEILYE
jgi:hypothetical protein|tara:strand:+ start:491 stop:658 length:168 start_codon:yes stop_codon:yes gene_type:complete